MIFIRKLFIQKNMLGTPNIIDQNHISNNQRRIETKYTSAYPSPIQLKNLEVCKVAACVSLY